MQHETAVGPITLKKYDELSSDRAKLSEVEMRKDELQHEYRMEELKFKQEQYRDKRDAQFKAEESEKPTSCMYLPHYLHHEYVLFCHS